MSVCVVGLGKIGLPLAVQIARKDLRVVGIDVDHAVVDAVNAGTVPYPGEDRLSELLADVVTTGRLSASIDTTGAVATCEVVIIVVPLVIDDEGHPDYARIDSATQAVAAGLTPGALVSYETTLPLHTTRGRFLPMLEKGSGLKGGEDFFVCHSPERVLTGRVFTDLARYPKLVGATDARGAAKAVAFYESVLDFDERPELGRPNGVWDLGSPEAAELAKLAETTYRNLNIAFANELAMAADRAGVDLAPVIEAANSQPFSHIHQPGIAVGGHCIPVYPHFLVDADSQMHLVPQGLAVNDGMPAYGVRILADLLGSLKGCRVAILGAAYRSGVKELAFSGVFPLARLLSEQGAIPLVHDPLFAPSEIEEAGLTPFALGSPCDAAVVQTGHDSYSALGPADLPGVRAIVDGRRALDRSRWPGVAFRCIGDGGTSD